MADFQQLARKAGATAEDGTRANRVFCLTESELRHFTDSVISEVFDVIDMNPQFDNTQLEKVSRIHLGTD